tara:strand:- start:118 stop:1272 length:1155 start_codon:yes stop_codon:yes gene_type:complete
MTITRATNLANIGSGIGTIPAQPVKMGSAVTIGGGTGIITATTFDGTATSFNGNGANITALNGSNISSGTVAAARVATLNQDTTGTASIATNVTVADESSDTTCFPLFATAATGNLPPKSGTNLTFNSSTGALTASSFAGNATGLTGTPNIVVGSVTGTTASFSGNVNVGGVLTYDDVTNIDSVGLITARNGLQVLAGISTLNGQVNAGNLNVTGVVTATSFFGSGANLTGVISGVATKEGGTSKGTGQTSLNFTGATVTSAGSETTIAIAAAGISTAASTPTANAVIDIALGAAQYHELTLVAGITTINCTGGSVGESHSLVLNQPSSGITTVGFSTFFLFPSGAAPSMSEGNSKVDLISFVVKRVGTGGTQLLASAGLNYSN